MRPKHIAAFCGLLFSVVFSSCSDDSTDNIPKGSVKANIQAGIGITTRASDSTWDVDDAIGIAMMDYEQTHIIDNIYNYRYYTPTGTESFEPSSSNEVLYFPQDGSRVYYKSYYPYLPDLNPDMMFPVYVGDQSDLPAIDAMTGKHLSGFSKGDPNVHLRMHHRLTKVIFKISRGEGLEDLPMFASNVTIHGMKVSGICDILNDTVYVDNDIQDIVIPDRGEESERSGIVMPRDAGEGVTFDFNFTDGSTFTAAMSDTLQLLSEHKYTFYIVLEKTGVRFWVDIQDWIDTPPSYFEIINATYPFENENVDDGDEMNVFMKATDGTFKPFDDFVYRLADDSWHSKTHDPNLTWEDAVPFEESTTFRASMQFADSQGTNQMADILTSDEVTVDRYHGVGLTFMHDGSRIVVRLQSTTFTPAELESAQIVLPQYLIGGHLEMGAFVAGTDRGDVAFNEDNPADMFAIIQPQTVPARNDIVKITINGESYSATRNTPYNFEKGKSYLLDVTLNKTEVDLGVRIIPWEIGGTLDLSVQAIQVAGTLEGTDDFFLNQSIHVYKFGNSLEEVQYDYAENGGVKSWTGPTLYWDDNVENLPLVMAGAYYPQGNVPTGITTTNPTFPWNLPDDQSTGYDQYDLLMDTVQITVPEMVNFHFQHVLSKVIVSVVSAVDNGVAEFTDAELDGATIELNNFVLNGRASLATGTVVGTGTRTSLIPMAGTGEREPGATPAELKHAFSGIVIPQTILRNTSVIGVKLDAYGDETFNGSIQDDLLFEAGKITYITLTLSKTRIQISATLEPWVYGDTGQVIIQ